MSDLSTTEILARLEKHEAQTAMRLEMIERRLDSGSDRMKRLEGYVIAVYPFFIGVLLALKLL